MPSSQTPAAAASRLWVNVNFAAFTPAQRNQIYTRTQALFGEAATWSATYPGMAGRAMDVEAGYKWRRRLGFGARVAAMRFSYRAGLGVGIPSPTFFNAFGSDTDLTTTLKRTDRLVDLFVTYDLPLGEAWNLRVSGGPSVFAISQEMVSSIAYTQSFGLTTPVNNVDITAYETETRTSTRLGFNVGGDVAYFFSRRVGIGGAVRMSIGRATIAEPLREETVSLTLGGTAVSGGVRIRF